MSSPSPLRDSRAPLATRRRLDLLARAHPALFPRAQLLRLLREQLGHVDALDRWIARGPSRVRARAPRLVYHVCAGNLAISAITSVAHGLLLGARNAVKLPGDRDDASTRREILAFVRALPAPLRRLVDCHSRLDETLLCEADAVIAFGGDAAMSALRGKVCWDRKFIAHGPAVSLLWLAEPDRLTARQARACAIDVLTYDQLGCLSPQAIYFPPGADIGALGDKLARALENQWRATRPKPPRPLAAAARIAEARDVALALGNRVWLPRHLGWSLIHEPEAAFAPSPLHGVIHLRSSSPSALTKNLASIRGRLSTVGLVAANHPGKTASLWREAFLSLGASRFCPAGRMQFPPLTWHHDGRTTLADLVTWIDAEGAA